jgi:chromosome segregation ATPase
MDNTNDFGDNESGRGNPKSVKTTFSLKCFEEDANNFKDAMKAMGPGGSGYAFARHMSTLLVKDGLIGVGGSTLPEIVSLKKTLSRLSTQYTNEVFVTLDSFAIKWNVWTKELERLTTETEKTAKNWENDSVRKDLEIIELKKQNENLGRENLSICAERENTGKLITVLENQISEKNVQLDKMKIIVENKENEVKGWAEKVRASEESNNQLVRQVQEANQKLSALQSTYEKLKVEERANSQKLHAEQMENLRSKLESKMKSERDELKGFYDERIAELTASMEEWKAEAKSRQAKK